MKISTFLFLFSRHSIRQALGMRSLKSPQSRLRQSQTPPWACLMFFYPFKASVIHCLPREVNLHPSFPLRVWIFLPLQSQEISWNKMACFIAVGCIWQAPHFYLKVLFFCSLYVAWQRSESLCEKHVYFFFLFFHGLVGFSFSFSETRVLD